MYQNFKESCQSVIGIDKYIQDRNLSIIYRILSKAISVIKPKHIKEL